MKNFALIFLVSLLALASCKKQKGHKELVQMDYQSLAKELDSTIALVLFDRAGKTEEVLDTITESGALGKVVAVVAKKKVKQGATLAVVEDLFLEQLSANDFTSTVSVNGQWFSYQVFVPDAGNDGAVARCNKNYNAPGDAPPNEPCIITDLGDVRTFSSDFDYTVHLSNKIRKTS